MRRHRRVKILATLGPASQDPTIVEKLFLAGADVFRINMSHASHDGMRERIATIRAIEKKHRRPIGILVDLQGPKLRCGEFKDGGVTLEKGDRIVFDSKKTVGDASRVNLPHPEILRALKPGDTVLVDDGKMRLQVIEAEHNRAVLEAKTAGRLSNRKGVSLPDTEIPVSAMTEKDRSDLDAALAAGVDWIAVSFVQRADDVAEVKKIARGRALVLAKIEKPQAIARLEEIVETADAIMVARGDLGVEMPVEKVPGLQKRMNRLARRLGKPVVVATQMLESMITAPVPTRAEVSDVATAVYEGADAVMLSAESAAGQFPIEAVTMMNKIATEVESDSVYRAIITAQRSEPEPTGADAIAVAAHDVAETLDMRAICAWSFSGATALRVARERPKPPVIALTPNVDTARRLALVWGVHPIVTKDASDVDDMAKRACKFANREGFSKEGDRIIVIAGLPFGTPGATNMLRIAFTGSDS
ncbi:pyruvate kinase [Methylocella sp. CPCC 101449]|uniref:pyruvate kinase n=1 Tax=Methylocella sp. CPCC 101449 TaxID=2987531 RepID=UPI002890562A|nr:pyruvate kinase [Methylocella sp. CPCC 101449]MDT2023598.1 pyruvate kinase [Methylocella sp. CPCC 101449]